ncbi:MAG: L-seryl-tRNA(Sec) selenium transferase [Henriciella sp.]|jgi:L-seryl-tRNA(Ser) seleniumtransferase
MTALLRQLPQVQSLLEHDQAVTLLKTFGHEALVNEVRLQLQQRRDKIQSDERGELTSEFVSREAILSDTATNLRFSRTDNFRPVINATGIIIHTNLGRAKLAPAAIEAVQRTAGHYSNLEFDLAFGKRGSRFDHVEDLICRLTGAEAAIVVNNCAAAVMASLSVFAFGKEVLASRGELVEIGGSFRMPDVIRQSGAQLVEVGSTNKTRIADYADGITENSGVLLKSHTSNFKMVGFTAAPSREELAELAAKSGLTFIEDLGSGVLIDLSRYGLPDEPVVADVVKSGADLVLFSGDKLLGGPQAGIIVGKKSHVDKLRKHPVVRAMRIDKLSLAALEATSRLYLPPNNPVESIPVLAALATPVSELNARAQKLSALLGDRVSANVTIVSSTAYAGGGSLPQQDLESYAVQIAPLAMSVEAFASELRGLERPIIGRISKDALLLDMRSVADSEIEKIAHGVCEALAK